MLAGLARWIGFLTMTVVLVGVMFLTAGFLWFTWNIPSDEASMDRKADGIVVLTGAAARIPDMPCTPAPGGADEEQRKTRGFGVSKGCVLSIVASMSIRFPASEPPRIE